MEKRLQHYLHFLKDKKVVIWGMGELFTQIKYAIRRLEIQIDFFTSSDSIGGFYHNIPILPYKKLAPETHYVIIATAYSIQITSLLEERGFLELQNYYPWCADMLHQDFLYDSVPIGRNTYGYLAYSAVLGKHTFGDCISSIGKYTSINTVAYMQIDHSMSMLSQGDFDFLSDDEYAFYKKKYENQVYFPPYNKVRIGHDVWIGAFSFINASKVNHIGNGAVIGAGAVVIEDVPPYAVVVGAPARIIKYRFTEKQIEILERVQWWNWDNKTLYEHKEYFFNPDLFFEKYSS